MPETQVVIPVAEAPVAIMVERPNEVTTTTMKEKQIPTDEAPHPVGVEVTLEAVETEEAAAAEDHRTVEMGHQASILKNVKD